MVDLSHSWIYSCMIYVNKSYHVRRKLKEKWALSSNLVKRKEWGEMKSNRWTKFGCSVKRKTIHFSFICAYLLMKSEKIIRFHVINLFHEISAVKKTYSKLIQQCWWVYNNKLCCGDGFSGTNKQSKTNTACVVQNGVLEIVQQTEWDRMKEMNSSQC